MSSQHLIASASLTRSVPQLLDLVAKPVKAVILLFPIRGKLADLRQEEEEKIKEKGQVPIDPTVFWIKQTVRRAGVAPSAE
jgi:ubiquitin carboxyl-terminal hydrolase L3